MNCSCNLIQQNFPENVKIIFRVPHGFNSLRKAGLGCRVFQPTAYWYLSCALRPQQHILSVFLANLPVRESFNDTDFCKLTSPDIETYICCATVLTCSVSGEIRRCRKTPLPQRSHPSHLFKVLTKGKTFFFILDSIKSSAHDQKNISKIQIFKRSYLIIVHRLDQDRSCKIILWDKHENFSCTIPDGTIFVESVQFQSENTNKIQYMLHHF